MCTKTGKDSKNEKIVQLMFDGIVLAIKIIEVNYQLKIGVIQWDNNNYCLSFWALSS